MKSYGGKTSASCVSWWFDDFCIFLWWFERYFLAKLLRLCWCLLSLVPIVGQMMYPSASPCGKEVMKYVGDPDHGSWVPNRAHTKQKSWKWGCRKSMIYNHIYIYVCIYTYIHAVCVYIYNYICTMYIECLILLCFYCCFIIIMSYCSCWVLVACQS